MEQRGIAITRCPFVLYGLALPSSRIHVPLADMRIDLNADVGEVVRRVHDRSRRRADAVDHVRQHRRRAFTPATRPSSGDTIRLAKAQRRRRRRASGLSRSRGLRPPRDARHAAGSRGSRALSDCRRRRRRGGRRRQAAARQAAWRALQHGGAGRRAGGGHRARGRRLRSLADPVRAAGLGAPEGRPRRRLRVAAEVFADRAYEPDGSLVSRKKPARSFTMPTPSSRARFGWRRSGR